MKISKPKSRCQVTVMSELIAGSALLSLLSGCATSASLAEQPHLQETLEAACPVNMLRQCRAWGGNKFRKRYEYCGCRRT